MDAQAIIPSILGILISVGVISIFVYFMDEYFANKKYLKNRQIKKFYAADFKQEWIDILEQKMDLYKILPADLKEVLHQHIYYFLQTKTFHGTEGLEITEEMKLTIAGDACIPVLKRDDPIYPDFTRIFVCKDAYERIEQRHNGDVLDEVIHSAVGTSWLKGPLLLAWKYASFGASAKSDGSNVTLHEFAHKLDGENGATNGLPILRNKKDYKKWEKVMRCEYDQFCKRVHRGANKTLNEYGATSPAEFFAVATEAFFEKSIKFEKNLPRLYGQFAHYYQLDPAKWHRHYNQLSHTKNKR